ncbi:MAG: BamA/TamA family outer membrane protein [Magnetococcus sp. MYC-9]
MKRQHRWAFLLCVWVLAGAALCRMAWAEETDIPYTLQFSGLESPAWSALEPLLRAASLCEQEKGSPPASRFLLLRRVKQDEGVLTGVLHSRGYFAARLGGTVTYDGNTDRTAAQVTFAVEPGPLYHLGRVTVELLPQGSVVAGGDGVSPGTDAVRAVGPVPAESVRFVIPTPEALSLAVGEEAVSRKIFAAEEKMLLEAKKQGFAFAKLAPRHTLVDHDKQTLEVMLRMETGPQVLLGAVRLTGTEEIATDYLYQRIPWDPAREVVPYHPQRLEEIKKAMLATGLFNAVRIRVDPEADAQGHHPLAIDLTQRKHRSISTGVGYSTGTGAKVAASWEHRNALGAGETVQVKGQAAENMLHLEGAFGKPDFLQMQQKLLLSASLDKEDTEAFYKDSFGVDAGLNRLLTPQLDLSHGVGYRLVNEKDRSGSQQEKLFGLFSTPVKLTWDERDDLLDPNQGWYMNLLGSGIIDTLGSGVWFGKFSSQYRHYYPVMDHPRMVLAGRLGAGTIMGSSREDVPADERFFVGGGGSLRGYGFQMAGEVDKNKKPLGGRSMLEFSTEARLQATESVGVVAFLDGGRAFTASTPEINEPLMLGTGGGIRYKTPIGPLRLDVGVPVQKRENIDDPFQFYVSIGQAF